jgi:endonuclease G
MKKYFALTLILALAAVWSVRTVTTSAQSEKRSATDPLVSPNIVISQLYGGGGASGAPYTNDFVELFNRGNTATAINGWSVQYASAGGTNWIVNNLPNATIQPGQYFLIQFASEGNVGNPLPTPDFIAPAVTVNGSTFILNMSRTTGKLALVNTTTQLPAASCPADASIVDLIGYGSGATCFEGAKTPDLSVSTAALRKNGGNVDTDNNLNDFVIGSPAPRNSSTPVGSFQATIAASPSVVAPGGNSLLTVSVTPATNPPSTGITVTGNLSDIGGSATQTFFDDATHGDVTAGDNVFSFLATVPANTVGGTHSVTAVAADAQTRTVNLNQNLTVNANFPDENPLLLGNPNNATPDIANENNYLMIKPQYTLSYNRAKATPNWVAWRLDSTWIGSAPRQDDFRPDPALPIGWYQVQDSDYSGSGYDRGHMCPSGDRTRSIPDNSATFLMTNFVPQLAANNQGPWEDLESYCRLLASQGNELYIIDGPNGNQGTIASGHIVVPQYTWKVVLVLPNGSDDLHRVWKGTRAFGVIVPNFAPVDINAPWRNFRVTVNQVENLTGYDFFNQVPKITQETIERRRDNQ